MEIPKRSRIWAKSRPTQDPIFERESFWILTEVLIPASEQVYYRKYQKLRQGGVGNISPSENMEGYVEVMRSDTRYSLTEK